MTERRDEGSERVEATVKNCYSTWGTSYYSDYYGPNAPYPPVHVDLVTSLLRKTGARRVLDAGCGPASMMRHLSLPGVKLYGFDLTPEMVEEAKRVVAASGIGADRVWQGSVLSAEDFRAPAEARADYDCVVSCGVLPHIPVEHDVTVIENLRRSLRPGGHAIVEGRNELFSLFTMNRYSHQFFLERLIPVEQLRADAGEEAAGLDLALEQVKSMFRTDLPPVRKGKSTEPGYDEVLSRTHNPLVLKQQFEAAGFTDAKLYFYHFHTMPPMVSSNAPALFRRSSVAMEQNPEDWRGLFMASAFFVVARAP
jgi:SAM-dependent methyltransferase